MKAKTLCSIYSAQHDCVLKLLQRTASHACATYSTIGHFDGSIENMLSKGKVGKRNIKAKIKRFRMLNSMQSVKKYVFRAKENGEAAL